MTLIDRQTAHYFLLVYFYNCKYVHFRDITTNCLQTESYVTTNELVSNVNCKNSLFYKRQISNNL